MRRLDGDDAGLLGIAPRVSPRVGPLGRGHDDLALDLEIGTGMLERGASSATTTGTTL